MNTHEHTDPDGDALTITTNHQGTWITATNRANEVTVGPFPATVLKPAGPLSVELPSVVRIINERTDAIARAEEAEQARVAAQAEAAMCQTSLTGQIRRAEKAEQEREQAEGALAAYVTAQASRGPRPLTPDAITDEFAAMTAKLLAERGHGWVPFHYMREAMRGAIDVLATPARPEGAEEIESAIRAWDENGDTNADHGDWDNLADYLASRGVRVVTEEQP